MGVVASSFTWGCGLARPRAVAGGASVPAGAEVTIAYIDPAAGVVARRAELLQSYQVRGPQAEVGAQNF